jgi:hypothetical protein
MRRKTKFVWIFLALFSSGLSAPAVAAEQSADPSMAAPPKGKYASDR